MFGLKRLKKRVKALIVLFVTSFISAGGYVGRDHPIMQSILGSLGINLGTTGQAGVNPETAKAIITAVVDKFDPYRKPGEFEVAIEKLRLDDSEFQAGSTVDLHVRVVRYDSQSGKGVVVWDGREEGGRPHVAGKGPIVAGWPEKPFRVEWKEGVDFDVEVWNRKGLKATKKLVFESESDGSFPLRSKTHTFDIDASGKALRNPADNTIAFRATRLAGSDTKSTESIADKGRTDRPSTRR
jgi:hypothetical protein